MNYVRFAALLESVLLFGCAQPKPQAVIHPVRNVQTGRAGERKQFFAKPANW